MVGIFIIAMALIKMASSKYCSILEACPNGKVDGDFCVEDHYQYFDTEDDLKVEKADNVEDCMQLCQAEIQCLFFSFHKIGQKCVLMADFTAFLNEGYYLTTSGYKISEQACGK